MESDICSKPHRRPFRWIKYTFAALIAASCLMALWNRHRQLELIDAIEQAGGHVLLEPSGLLFLRSIIGEEFMRGWDNIVEVSLDGPVGTDALMNSISTNSSIRLLHVTNCSVTDRGASVIMRMRHLQDLSLSGTRITDDSMTAITEMLSLRKLDVSNTPISDKGVIILSSKNTLESLDLYGTQVTDKGVRALCNAKDLRHLSLPGRMQVSSDAIFELQASLPKCGVVRYGDPF